MREELRGSAEGQAAPFSVPDYNEVMSGAYKIPVNAQMLAFLRDSTTGPALGYLLAKHPADAEEIFRRVADSRF